MQVYLLYEERLGPVPKGIRIVENYGVVAITAGSKTICGKSMILEGDQEAFIAWLKPFDRVWIGEGQPIEERFRAARIRRNND